MPELPEVEVTRRAIAPVLEGYRIADVQTTAPSYFFITDPKTLKRRLRGRVVKRLERRGKYILAHLDNDAWLLLHLGMTGQLFTHGASSLRLLSSTSRATLTPEQQPTFNLDAHTHLILSLDGGGRLFFRDVRKFGKVEWIEDIDLNPRLSKLGPDALSVTGEHLFRVTRKRKTLIKALLLDQSVLAGVGNIYADESLFHAGVRPTRRAIRVTRRECEALADHIKRILNRSIETGGSSISDYIQPDGSDGGFQDERRVYARNGDDCLVCGTAIKKTRVAQRGTHYCPSCQK